jgi:hypothetical protein
MNIAASLFAFQRRFAAISRTDICISKAGRSHFETALLILPTCLSEFQSGQKVN